MTVDDSITVRKFAEMVLTKEGYEVALAANGNEFLSTVEQFQPDLVLLDFVLPDLPSQDICERLLGSERTKNIPVLMISSNGNAIRTMYQNCKNVKDYLTKPFQANILASVVKHVLEKTRKEQEEAAASASVQAAMSTPLMDDISTALPVPPPVRSVTRPPLKIATGRTTTPFPAKVSTPAPMPVSLPPSVPAAEQLVAGATQAEEALLLKIRQVVENKYASLARFIPELESKRAGKAPEPYYLSFLARPKVLSDMAQALREFHEESVGAPTTLAGTSEIMSTDTVLLHLASKNSTGALHLQLNGELVKVFFHNGLVAAISSDNPKNYCTGAAFDFKSLARERITQAVVLQRRYALPFFAALHQDGYLNGEKLAELLRTQGRNTIVRALTAASVEFRFHPLAKLPAWVEQFSLKRPVRDLMLEVYRGVEDWLTIESTIGDYEAILGRSKDYSDALSRLPLTGEEKQILDLIDGQLSVQEVINWSGSSAFVVGGILYRFIKMGLLDFIYRPPVKKDAEA